MADRGAAGVQPRLRHLLALLAAAMLSGCARFPAPGEPLIAEIAQTVTPAEVARSFPWIRNALAQGATAEDFAQGRLGLVTCAAAAPDGFRETWYPVRLPPGLAEGGWPHVLVRPGVERAAPGPLGEALRRLPDPAPADMVEARTAGPLTVRLVPCVVPAEPGLLRGRLDLRASASMLGWVRDEDDWAAVLPADALAQGRIVRLVCTPAVRETRRLYAEVPPGLSLAPGDVVEAVAGVPMPGPSGPLTRILRRLETAPQGSRVEYRPGRFLPACVPP